MQQVRFDSSGEKDQQVCGHRFSHTNSLQDPEEGSRADEQPIYGLRAKGCGT